MLEEELKHLRDVAEQIEREVRRGRKEADRLLDQKSESEKQLGYMRSRIQELKEEQRAVNLEQISLRRDRDHYTDEVAFLRRLADGENEEVTSLKQFNLYLEKSYQNMEAHTAELERGRKEVREQIKDEKDRIRKEERETAEMKNKLELMRREMHISTTVRAREEAEYAKIRQEMQRRPSDGDNAGPSTPLKGAPDDSALLRRVATPSSVVSGVHQPNYGGGRDDAAGSSRPRDRVVTSPRQHSWSMSLMPSTPAERDGGGVGRPGRDGRDGAGDTGGGMMSVRSSTGLYASAPAAAMILQQDREGV